MRSKFLSVLRVCPDCGSPQPPVDLCSSCGHELAASDTLVPGTGLGLIGLPNSGKTCYLAALHDELMHGAPEWRVRVGDAAFDRLTTDFWSMMSCGIPQKTDFPGSACFPVTVYWHDHPVTLLMNDMAGEYTYRVGEENEDGETRESLFGAYLEQCRSILVSIPCWLLPCSAETPQGRCLAKGYGNDAFSSFVKDSDLALGRVFRRILTLDTQLRQVVITLTGVDLLGQSPSVAVPLALKTFNQCYRVFPGLLTNAQVKTDIVPVSNIGFGNAISFGTDDGHPGLRVQAPPLPWNVLEPLRRALPFYLPELNAPQGRAPTPEEHERRAFLSYRRETGADAARLIRNALRERGWRAFLDVDDLGVNHFEDRLLLELERSEAVVLLLSPGSLDRCGEPGDWVCREIAHAIQCGKPIVPVMKEGFVFPSPASLPPSIASLPQYNGVAYSHQYFDAMVHKLVSFLKSCETIETPLPGTAPAPGAEQGRGAPKAEMAKQEPPTFEMACPHCAATLVAQDDWIGQEGECPKCGHSLVIGKPPA